MTNSWEMYDRLIEGVPEGIAVREVYVARSWLYVDAECGMGISHVVPSGALARDGRVPESLSLRELAGWVKSWSFLDASIGVAALNAWYSQQQRVAGAKSGDWRYREGLLFSAIGGDGRRPIRVASGSFRSLG